MVRSVNHLCTCKADILKKDHPTKLFQLCHQTQGISIVEGLRDTVSNLSTQGKEYKATTFCLLVRNACASHILGSKLWQGFGGMLNISWLCQQRQMMNTITVATPFLLHQPGACTLSFKLSHCVGMCTKLHEFSQSRCTSSYLQILTSFQRS